MKKITLVFLGLMMGVSIFMPQLAPTAMAEIDSIGEVKDAGILPSSPFYFLKSWWRSTQLFFTSDPLKEAQLLLNFTNEDALAIKKLAEQKQWKILNRFMNSYQNRVREINKKMEKASQENRDTNYLTKSFGEDILKHQKILSEIYIQAPDETKQELESAIATSRGNVKQALEKAVGPQSSLEFEQQSNEAIKNMGEDVRLKIQEQSQNEGQRSDKTIDNTQNNSPGCPACDDSSGNSNK